MALNQIGDTLPGTADRRLGLWHLEFFIIQRILGQGAWDRTYWTGIVAE